MAKSRSPVILLSRKWCYSSLALFGISEPGPDLIPPPRSGPFFSDLPTATELAPESGLRLPKQKFCRKTISMRTERSPDRRSAPHCIDRFRPGRVVYRLANLTTQKKGSRRTCAAGPHLAGRPFPARGRQASALQTTQYRTHSWPRLFCFSLSWLAFAGGGSWLDPATRPTPRSSAAIPVRPPRRARSSPAAGSGAGRPSRD
jgi:hypothetical protein